MHGAQRRLVTPVHCKNIIRSNVVHPYICFKVIICTCQLNIVNFDCPCCVLEHHIYCLWFLPHWFSSNHFYQSRTYMSCLPMYLTRLCMWFLRSSQPPMTVSLVILQRLSTVEYVPFRLSRGQIALFPKFRLIKQCDPGPYSRFHHTSWFLLPFCLALQRVG